MRSKRYKKLPQKTKELKSETLPEEEIEELLRDNEPLPF